MNEPIDRRTAVKLAASGTLAFAFGCSWSDVENARDRLESMRAEPYSPEFFNAHEWQTVGILTDLIIPEDDRSPGATQAGVPEFIDVIMHDRGGRAAERMREGLAWLDAECQRRFTKDFVDGSNAERRRVLDDIAWPDRAAPEHGEGVAFFNAFRDLTGAGFFSSRIGVDDLEYTGNRYVTQWDGCTEPALRKLGVSYG